MFEYLPQTSGHVVAIKTTGHLQKEDYDTLLPQLEEKMKQVGKINLYWEMTGFEGWTPGGFLQESWFDLKHLDDFGKIAIVGDKDWQETVSKVMKPLSKAPLRYFDRSQQQQALQWIKED